VNIRSHGRLLALSLLLFAALLAPGRAAHAAIDFNNDNFPDLLFQSQSTNQLVYWALDGSTYLNGDFLQSPISTDWKVMDSADFNADGKADLVYQNATTNQVVLWYMNGASMIGGGAISLTPATGYKVVGTGDFNADGRRDLVFQNTATGQIVFWYLNGLIVTGGDLPIGLSSPPRPNAAVVGVSDFNSDTMPDLVMQDRSTREISFIFMQGIRAVAGTISPLIPVAGYSVVGLGDFNSDGKADLLFQNTSTGQLVYWLLNGTVYNGYGSLPEVSSADWRITGIRSFAPFTPQTYSINGITYATTNQHETLKATFTQPDGGISLAGYKGYVRLHISGVGVSYPPEHNDAFYLYDGRFASSPTHGWDGAYYQLTYSSATLPNNDAGADAFVHLVGGTPAYNPTHEYTVLLDTGLATAGQLHFGVSDAGFSDNSGAYTITVTQLTPAP